jgi:hypothetical protein
MAADKDQRDRGEANGVGIQRATKALIVEAVLYRRLKFSSNFRESANCAVNNEGDKERNNPNKNGRRVGI